MSGRLRLEARHERPFASLVAFAWALLLMVTLKVLLDRGGAANRLPGTGA